MKTITPAERAALEAVMRNGSAKAAAHALGKRPQTIKNQLASLRGRLDVGSTIEAVRVVFVDRA